MLSISGLFAPIPTPFDDQDEVDFAALEANLSVWNAKPMAGLVVGGSNGEFVHLNEREKTQVVKFARTNTPSDRIIIAGTGELSTRLTLQMCEAAAQAGAQAVLVVTPFYYKSMMSKAAVISHYQFLAERSTLPMILYNMPANTGLDMPLEAVVELSHHPNIIGIKDSGGNVTKIGRIVADGAVDFQVLAGSASFLLGALAVGAVGAVAALANIDAPRLDLLMQAYSEGKMDRAAELQRSVLEVNDAVTGRFGVAGLKAAMDMMGLRGGPVRQPLLPLEQPDLQTLRQILERCGLLD